jgi:hypothetical protein
MYVWNTEAILDDSGKSTGNFRYRQYVFSDGSNYIDDTHCFMLTTNVVISPYNNVIAVGIYHVIGLFGLPGDDILEDVEIIIIDNRGTRYKFYGTKTIFDDSYGIRIENANDIIALLRNNNECKFIFEGNNWECSFTVAGKLPWGD